MSEKCMPLIVAHYTADTGYEREVKGLIRSLEALGLEHRIVRIRSLGTWRANSNYCAVSIREALHVCKRDILRVDADAIFHKRPTIFEEEDFDADIAAHVHDFRWHHNELLGGTLFFRYCPEVLRLIEDWVKLCFYGPRCKERNGDLLQELIQSGEYPIRFGHLPATYCKIFDLMADVQDPVIEHFQASRRFKQQINIQGVERK